jgi:hypothetical protein
VDAAYKAIDGLVRVDAELVDYSVNSVTEGIQVRAFAMIMLMSDAVHLHINTMSLPGTEACAVQISVHQLYRYIQPSSRCMPECGDAEHCKPPSWLLIFICASAAAASVQRLYCSTHTVTLLSYIRRRWRPHV